ncbi:hypothetical protein P350_33890 [Burkholderia cepacia JBK9]|nr:hypothetical protein P350_33890 [Burkholderia cepacia JBK9]
MTQRQAQNFPSAQIRFDFVKDGFCVSLNGRIDKILLKNDLGIWIFQLKLFVKCLLNLPMFRRAFPWCAAASEMCILDRWSQLARPRPSFVDRLREVSVGLELDERVAPVLQHGIARLCECAWRIPFNVLPAEPDVQDMRCPHFMTKGIPVAVHSIDFFEHLLVPASLLVFSQDITSLFVGQDFDVANARDITS